MADTVTAADLPTLRLKRNEDRRLQAGHLWVFSNEIDTGQTPLTKFTAGVCWHTTTGLWAWPMSTRNP
jgi:hypothetical protein